MNTLAVKDASWDKLLSSIPEELVDKRDRHRLIKTLVGIVNGESWSELAIDGLSRPEYSMLKRRSPEFASMAKEAEAVADDVKQSIREEEAHNRAVNGETIPVYTMKGELAGEYQKRSDKLMEVLLRANNPGKYATGKSPDAGGGGIVLQVAFGIPNRVKTINVEALDDPVEPDRQLTAPADSPRNRGTEAGTGLVGGRTDENPASRTGRGGPGSRDTDDAGLPPAPAGGDGDDDRDRRLADLDPEPEPGSDPETGSPGVQGEEEKPAQGQALFGKEIPGETPREGDKAWA